MKAPDPFLRGLRQFFATHPDIKPATVGTDAGLSKSSIRKMIEGLVGSPRHENAVKIANAIGMTVDEVIALGSEGGSAVAPSGPSIAVAGKVGAGAEVQLFDAYEKGDGHYHITCPPQISPHGVVAVEVSGDSMAPTYMPGSILFYSRSTIGVPTEAIGRICVCEDAEGRAWVKQVRPGRVENTFTLISLNPDHDHRHGIRLKWAAPVRFSLPPEFVRKLD